MDDVSKNFHLLKRGNTWYYKRRVPLHLVSIIGKPFLRRSLKTTDKNEAKKLRSIEDVKADALFAAAEQEVIQRQTRTEVAEPIPMELVVEHIRRYVEDRDKQFAEWLALARPADADELKTMRDDLGIEMDAFTIPGRANEEAVSRATDTVLRHVGFRFEDRATLARVAEIVQRAMVELLGRKLDRLENRFGRSFRDVLFDPERRPAITFATASQMFMEERLKDYRLNGVAERPSGRSFSCRSTATP